MSRGNQNEVMASSSKNHLNDLEFNEVNLGDQLD
jgi:alpha-tubulin suppressor-like RCC1 family protein